MRLCLVIEAGGGGAGRHVIDLAGEMTRRGHHVHLIYSDVRAEPRYLREIAALPISRETIDIRRSLGLHDLGAVQKLSAALKRSGPFDIVHGHSSKAGAIVRLAAVGGAKRVYTPHAFRGLDPHASVAARTVFNGAEILLGATRTDALIAVSGEELDFARRLHIADGRCHLIRNGVVDVPDIDRATARRTLDLPDDAIVIGFVGRLSYQKAPERFIEVMAGAMRADPRVHAVVLGDGECAAETEAGIAASGVAERFVWHKSMRAQDVIPAFDAIMMTSRYEGLSYVMLESLAGGVPIITTAVAGAQDVIGNTGCGIVTRNDDRVIEGLTEAVMRIVADAGLRAGMAEAARRRSGELNGPRMVDETEALYRSLTQESQR